MHHLGLKYIQFLHFIYTKGLIYTHPSVPILLFINFARHLVTKIFHTLIAHHPVLIIILPHAHAQGVKQLVYASVVVGGTKVTSLDNLGTRVTHR